MYQRLSVVVCVVATLLAVLLLADAAHAEPRFAHAFSQLSFSRPLYLTHVPGGGDRIVVVEQVGRVWIFDNRADVSERTLAIDLSQKIRSPEAPVRRGGNEEGLLGLAFHPEFATNRQVFLYYTAASDPRRSVISRFVMDEAGEKIDASSEQVIMEVRQPWGNHNGGGIEFGPDGFLYITLGDGGSAGDPQDNGQNLGTLLGSILRIDVDRQDEGKRYAVPEDNPFVDNPDARDEIWAYGLRNVWRFSFDRKTGELWAGDVGQNKYEEIDLIEKGGNYGWRIREGAHPYERGREGENLIDPVVDHGRRETWSITGGYVYRGEALPDMVGAYIYGDFGSGRIWRLRYVDGQVTEHEEMPRVPLIASFGEDAAGEMYITSFDGKIYKLIDE